MHTACNQQYHCYVFYSIFKHQTHCHIEPIRSPFTRWYSLFGLVGFWYGKLYNKIVDIGYYTPDIPKCQHFFLNLIKINQKGLTRVNKKTPFSMSQNNPMRHWTMGGVFHIFKGVNFRHFYIVIHTLSHEKIHRKHTYHKLAKSIDFSGFPTDKPREYS